MNETVAFNSYKQLLAVSRTQSQTSSKREVSGHLLTPIRAKFGDPGLSRTISNPQVAMIPVSLSSRDGGWAVKAGNNGY